MSNQSTSEPQRFLRLQDDRSMRQFSNGRGPLTGRPSTYQSGEQMNIRFDGATYESQADGCRLSAQLNFTRALLIANVGRYFSLSELSTQLGYPEASISARLRDLRKAKHGAYTIHRRRRTAGTHEYAMIG